MSDEIEAKKAEINRLDAEARSALDALSAAKLQLVKLEEASLGLVRGKTKVRETEYRRRTGVFVEMNRHGWAVAHPLKANGDPSVRKVTFCDWEIVSD